MTQTLASAVRDALDIRGWDESIQAVKGLIAKSLSRLDSKVRVRDTGYFNHSFVPDFILGWDDGGADKRDVFLRLDSSPGFLASDLHYLHDGEPILYGLTENTDNDVDGTANRTQLEAESANSNTMITDSNAVERLGERTKKEFGAVVPAIVLKGGRGVITDDVASDLVAAGGGFFSAARSHEAAGVIQSATVFEKHLKNSEAQALENFGRIVWEATGGHPGTFPLKTRLSGLDDDAVRFLLDEGRAEDLDYWRTIGRTVGLERLLTLGVRKPKNLRSLLSANLDRLNARFMQVIPMDRTLLDDSSSWAMRPGAIEYRGDDFIGLFGLHREEVEAPEGIELSGRVVSIRDLRDQTTDASLQAVTLLVVDERITIESASQRALELSEILQTWPTGKVERVAMLVNGKHLECRFDDLVATGRTNAQFTLEELLKHGLPVLWPLSATDRDEIKELLSATRRAAEGRSLYDEGLGEG